MNKCIIANNSVIEMDVSVGDGTRIWYFTHVREGAKIGLNCNIGDYCYIGKNVIIGNDTRIGNGVSLYEGIIIKDRVFIGNGAVFTNRRNPSVKNRRNDYLTTVIHDDAYIGANATILGGVEVGRGAHIGESAVLTVDAPPYSIIRGGRGHVKQKLT